MAKDGLKLVGAYGSPYSRKMRAVLRYRRIPFRWLLRASPDASEVPPVPVALIPVLVLPGEDGAVPTAMVDSTFQITRLEQMQSARSIVPADPALAFLDALIEDYADEWLTKAMFHYRWAYAADAAKASHVLPLDVRFDLDPRQHEIAARAFAERQIGRLAVVGSNATTRDVIESSYRRLLEILAAYLTHTPFLLGKRPGRGDFGLFGQLTQLVQFDPTPSAVAAEVAPRVIAWVNRVEDLAWLDVDDEAGGWASRDPIPDTLRALLREIGRVYAPFLLANAAALDAGAAQVTCAIDGARWEQKPFPYQAKCLRWLREGRAALAAGDRAWVDGVLAGTGCEMLFDERASR
jgi:glutathione S-transferase